MSLLNKVLILTLTTIPLSHQQQCDQQLVNSVVDFVLDQLVSKYPDTLTLPNISKTLFKDKSSIELYFGSASGLSSIKRVGDMKLDLSSDQMDIALTVSISNLTVGYRQYVFQALNLKSTGGLKMSAADNLIRVNALMKNKSLCLVEVNKVELLKLGDIHVGLNSCSKLCNKVANWISDTALNFFKNNLRNLIETRLNIFLQTILKPKNSTICKYMNI